MPPKSGWTPDPATGQDGLKDDKGSDCIRSTWPPPVSAQKGRGRTPLAAKCASIRAQASRAATGS